MAVKGKCVTPGFRSLVYVLANEISGFFGCISHWIQNVEEIRPQTQVIDLPE